MQTNKIIKQENHYRLKHFYINDDLYDIEHLKKISNELIKSKEKQINHLRLIVDGFIPSERI